MSSAPVTTPVPTPNKALLTWEDPARTGKVFGSIVAILIVFKTVNLFNVFFHVAYLGLTVAAAAEYAGKLVTGQGFVTKYKPAAKSYAKQFNNEVLPQVARCSEKFEEQIQKIIYAHDIEVTLKAAGVSYVLYKVTSWFSLYTLVFAGVVLTFTLPAVYVHNKKEIDAAVAQYTKLAKDKASELSATAHKKAGPHFDTLVKKTGPLGSFINSKLPVRTAGSTVGTETNGYKEPTSAHTTGASKFPEVPSSADDSVLDEFDDAADTSKVEVPVRL